MKKLFFVFMMTAFAVNIFAEGGGCTNKPLTNDGHCATSTYNGVIHYHCVDAGTSSKDCVKGSDIDEEG